MTLYLELVYFLLTNSGAHRLQCPNRTESRYPLYLSPFLVDFILCHHTELVQSDSFGHPGIGPGLIIVILYHGYYM